MRLSGGNPTDEKASMIAMDRDAQIAEMARLRDRHVGKLLRYLGSDSVPPYLDRAVKKAFSMFEEDVIANIIDSERDPEREESLH